MPAESPDQRYSRYHKEHFAEFKKVQDQIAKLATKQDLVDVVKSDTAFRTWFYRGLIAILTVAVITTAGGLVAAWKLGAAYDDDRTAMQHQIDHLLTTLQDHEVETP